MEECNIVKSWDEKCKNECESVQKVHWMDRSDMALFNKEECSTTIEFYYKCDFF